MWLKKGQLKWLLLSVVVIIVDQISKWLALQFLQLHQPVNVFPGFNWMLAFNTGAAFSFLGDAGGWQHYLFSAIALVVTAILIRWMSQMTPEEKLSGIASGLIIGGAIGNLIDRLLQGKVTDFIDWYYGDYHWATFNLADSFILLGAFLFIVEALFIADKNKVVLETKAKAEAEHE
ncbi:MAG TPA: lipoprotein signal peptidase [Aeromonadales bacterium]|nr:lipoprotein signal peptidase [Aeromonadales bacterium]